MSTQLEGILAHTRLQVDARRASADAVRLERAAAAHRPRGFEAALRRRAELRPAIIAELKKASPSRGLIRAQFDPPALAHSLASAGAAALSVLTDEAYFQGSLDYLRQASAAVTIPCLRKDFILDPFQVLEARAAGADAILLIAAALTDPQLELLFHEAQRMDLDVLCEVHDRTELDRAAALGATLIGVNSRNLQTMHVDPQTPLDLAPHIPLTALAVAESGIRTPADLARLRTAGYRAFLVGEYLMRDPDPAAALTALLAPRPHVRQLHRLTWAYHPPRVGREVHRPRYPPCDTLTSVTWVKICCNTNREDAMLAAELGADALGFVFAPSKRQVTPAQVASITLGLPDPVERVGVFQPEDPATDAEQIAVAAKAAGLHAVQLHGAFSDVTLQRLRDSAPGLGIVQTLHWDLADPDAATQLAGQLQRIAALGHIDRVLIDTKLSAATGGTGVSFDWFAARDVFAAAPSSLRLIVAGGLTPSNVAHAIAQLAPWGVDVCSGVEAAPGRKDPARIAKFIANARGAQTPY
jgi:indole-3-glycerol phosphate synthase